jgi:hypothetical protein
MDESVQPSSESRLPRESTYRTRFVSGLEPRGLVSKYMHNSSPTNLGNPKPLVTKCPQPNVKLFDLSGKYQPLVELKISLGRPLPGKVGGHSVSKHGVPDALATEKSQSFVHCPK